MLVLLSQGCYFHACPSCFKQRYMKFKGYEHTMEDIYQSHLTRIREIKDAGFRVVELWEHELNQQLSENPDMARFFEQADIQDPIDPREALRGGLS